MIKKIAGILVALLLVAGLGYQFYGTAQTLSRQFQNKVWVNRSLDAFVRSADASYGSDFAAYIVFLRASIPAQATVLIPPGGGSSDPQYDRYLMQYLLFPRTIVTCPSDCSAAIAEPTTYVLVKGDFPSPAAVPGTKHPVLFAGTPGFYAPGK